MAEDLTKTELEHKKKIASAVDRRAQAVRDQEEATRDIALLCQEARKDKIPMRLLASWVKVLDIKSDKLVPITRQSLDGMLAKLEGRHRAERKRPSNGRRKTSSSNSSKIKLDAFS